MRWSPCCFQITRMAHLTSSILGDCMDVAYWSLLWLNHSRLSRESIFIRPYQISIAACSVVIYPAMAAALIWSITKNHPFNDGNKRAALTTGILFLAFNGYHTLSRTK